MHQRRSVGDGRQHAELRRTERGSGGQQLLALPDILSPAPDIAPGVAIVEHGHAAFDQHCRVFLADDAVGARGNRRPREDARRLTGRERTLGELACGHRLDDAQRDLALACGPGNVRGADRVAVHA